MAANGSLWRGSKVIVLSYLLGCASLALLLAAATRSLARSAILTVMVVSIGLVSALLLVSTGYRRVRSELAQGTVVVELVYAPPASPQTASTSATVLLDPESFVRGDRICTSGAGPGQQTLAAVVGGSGADLAADSSNGSGIGRAEPDEGITDVGGCEPAIAALRRLAIAHGWNPEREPLEGIARLWRDGTLRLSPEPAFVRVLRRMARLLPDASVGRIVALLRQGGSV